MRTVGRLLGAALLIIGGMIIAFFTVDAYRCFSHWSWWQRTLAVICILLGGIIGFLLLVTLGARTKWPTAQGCRQRVYGALRSLSQHLTGEPWLAFLAPLSILVTMLLVCLYALDRFAEQRLHLYLGIAAILDVLLSLVIIANFENTRISSSQELLDHFYHLFRDGADNGKPVKVIHLFPNPGQFDSFYKLGRYRQFSALETLINQAMTTGVKPEFVCLSGDPAESSTTANSFLTAFWQREEYRLSGRAKIL